LYEKDDQLLIKAPNERGNQVVVVGRLLSSQSINSITKALPCLKMYLFPLNHFSNDLWFERDCYRLNPPYSLRDDIPATGASQG
jgi:hypothetical protein